MKSVALVGFSPTTLDGIWSSRVDEVWTLNNAKSTRKETQELPKVTRVFEMHPEGLLRHPLYDPQESGENLHWNWLMNEKHSYQVITLVPMEGVDNNKVYPFEAIEGHGAIVRDGEPVDYATATFCYMLALAIWENYDFIEIWGFDPATGTEYAYQKPGAEYWMGVARGRGIKIWLHKKSNLLNGSLYGYEASQMITRQMLEGYRDFYADMRKQAVNKLNYTAGKFDSTPPAERQALAKELNQIQSNVYQYDGALQFITTMIEVCDGKDLVKEKIAQVGHWSK